jgi:hypothetical protein
MKRKSVVLGLLALAGLALHVTEASAFFCCKPWRCHRGCHRCTTCITCRPYNAFTPICWGNLYCDGCCPSPCGVAGGQLPFQYMGGFGAYYGGMGCCPPTCAASMYPAVLNGGMMGYHGGTVLPDSTPAAPKTNTPAPGGSNFTPPTPAPATSYYYPGYNPYMNPYYGVMRTGYYPNYMGYGAYPNYGYGYGYNPAMYYGQMGYYGR